MFLQEHSFIDRLVSALPIKNALWVDFICFNHFNTGNDKMSPFKAHEMGKQYANEPLRDVHSLEMQW